ncbi:MAG TPA: hypothetical protein EYH07_03800 [Kiloniellaceae bacterium]|nr:hypothetical protein [Kiloniellaceae bacterium]
MRNPDSVFFISVLKGFLQGSWNLVRTIDDRRARQDGALTGTASFTAAGAELVYQEEGRLVIGDPANPVYAGPVLQSYRYAFPAPPKAEVRFRDGRFFHDLDLSQGLWACTHLCDPDRYAGEFTVLDADRWRVVWTVTGPRKEQTLDSTYRRAL